MRKYTSLLVLVLLVPVCLQAQLNFVYPVGTAKGGAITSLASDWESIGISPSNLAWSNDHTISATILNFGVSAQSDGLTIPNINNIINNHDTALLEKITASHGGLNIYANLIWAAFSIKIPKIGGFAVSISDRAYSNITMSPNVSSKQDYLTAYAAIASTAYSSQNAQKPNSNVNINTPDSIAYLVNTLNKFSGSKVSAYEYREINLAYGRELFKIGGDKSAVESYSVRSNDKEGKGDADSNADFNAFKFYGGVGLKYLIGMADLSGQFLDGTVTADYAIANKIAFSPIPSGPPGQGYAIDLGLSMAYRKWKFAVAATDFGSIKWTGTHSTLNDTTVVKRIIQDRGDSSSSNVSNYIQSNGETFTTILPAKFRFGASYELNKLLTVATDIILPLNNSVGNLQGTYYSIAAHLTILKIATFDAGFASAQYYGVVMPVGIAFGHKVQIYFGVNDILTYFGKEKNTDVSAAFGLIRVNL